MFGKENDGGMERSPGIWKEAGARSTGGTGEGIADGSSDFAGGCIAAGLSRSLERVFWFESGFGMGATTPPFSIPSLFFADEIPLISERPLIPFNVTPLIFAASMFILAFSACNSP